MKKVIFVDDDESILDIAKLIFSKAGYEVNLFSDGMPLVQGNFELPDIFILDKWLPEWDGLELCRMLKAEERTKDIPVIMLSAHTDIKKLAGSAGADGAIEKPFDIRRLLDMVEKFTDGK